MAFIAAAEVAIMRDNPAIINGSDPTPNMNVMGTCVAATIGWIPICSHECFIREWLRESLCAFALVNAHSIWIPMWATWPMYHDFGDNIVKMGLSNWIRELSTNNGVNLSWCNWFGSSIKKNEEVHMGEATLLELNGIDMGQCSSKDTLLGDFNQQSIHFEMEDLSNNVRAVTPSLPRE
jgi:hypothetical protein